MKYTSETTIKNNVIIDLEGHFFYYKMFFYKDDIKRLSGTLYMLYPQNSSKRLHYVLVKENYSCSGYFMFSQGIYTESQYDIKELGSTNEIF